MDSKKSDGRVRLLRLTLCAVIVASMLLTSFVMIPRMTAAATASWTFAVYLDADNNLQGDAVLDFLEMASVGSTASVNIVVQLTMGAADAKYAGWPDTMNFLVQKGMTPTSGNAVYDFHSVVNMADPNTLTAFGNWAFQNYPSTHRVLVIWDHGYGWDGGYCQAGHFANQMMSLHGVRTALSGINSLYKPIDILGFDACWSGGMETWYACRPTAAGSLITDFIAGEQYQPGEGWPYDAILTDLNKNPTTITVDNFASTIVSDYNTSYTPPAPVTQYGDPAYDSYWNEATLAAYRTSGLSAVNSSLLTFSDDLLASMSSYRTQYGQAYARLFWDPISIAGYNSYGSPTYYEYVDLYTLALNMKTYVPNTQIQSDAQALMTALLNARISFAEQGNQYHNEYKSKGISIEYPGSSYHFLNYESEDLELYNDWGWYLYVYYGFNRCPKQPGSLTFAQGDQNDGIVTLTWTDAVDKDTTGVSQYGIYESVNGGAWSGIWSGHGLSYALPYRSPGTYSYYVTAADTMGQESPPSPSVTYSVPWDARLTNNVANSNSPVVDKDSSGNFHIVWVDSRAGWTEIYYKKVDPNWNVLVQDTRLTAYNSNKNSPAIAVNSVGSIEVVYMDERAGTGLGAIYAIVYSPATGWGPANSIAQHRGMGCYSPDVVVDSAGGFNVIYRDISRTQTTKVNVQLERIWYLTASGGGGIAYQYSAPCVSYDRLITAHVAISGSSAVWHLLFVQGPYPYGSTVKYMRYAGGVWSAPLIMYQTTGSSGSYSCEVKADSSSGRVYAVWDNSNGYSYFARSDNTGVSWQPTVLLYMNNVHTTLPDIDSNGLGKLIVVQNTGNKIVYQVSTDWGATWTATNQLSAGSGVPLTSAPRICLGINGESGMVWTDYRDGNNEIYFAGKKL